MNDTSTSLEPSAPSVVRRHWSVSLVWLVPILAGLIGIGMMAHAWLSEGPEITIRFNTAAGLEAGKTSVKYKDVIVGSVTRIALSPDDTHVLATVALDKSAERLTAQDTRFWVVRPRIGVGGVSGFDTLLSGAYIAVDAGQSDDYVKAFTGLETPPTVVSDTPGKTYVLQAADLGSLSIGSPLYYRSIQVGQVEGFQLSDDGQSVQVQVFVSAPYDRFVNTDSRFWNASGVDVSVSADGLKLNTESVATILAGGIAFGSPPRSNGEPALANATYTLHKDIQMAMAPPDGPALYVKLRFEQSMRGLATGAPVQFSGMDFGRVVSIALDYDAKSETFPTMVGILIYPQRLGDVLERLPNARGTGEERAAAFLPSMVEHGLRAQARTANLLTGQLYISLDFIANTPRVAFDANARPIMLPTVNGAFDQLQEQMASIVGKINKIPLESIGRNLDTSLAELNRTLKQVNSQVLPATTQTMEQAQQTLNSAQQSLLEESPLQRNLNQTLQELGRTVRSLRSVTDMLGDQPESLIRGLSNNTPVRSVAPPAPARSSGH